MRNKFKRKVIRKSFGKVYDLGNLFDMARAKN